MRLADGTRRLDSESVLGASREVVQPQPETRLAAVLERAAAEAGLSLESVRFARPLGRLAAEVTVVSADRVAFLEHADQRAYDIAHPIIGARGGAVAEGILVAVESEAGETLAGYGYPGRITGGIGFTTTKIEH